MFVQLEMAEQLHRRGMSVAIVEALPQSECAHLMHVNVYMYMYFGSLYLYSCLRAHVYLINTYVYMQRAYVCERLFVFIGGFVLETCACICI
jgi:hypothetical protein